MQTFLPYTDFTKCAQVLDMRRLGKQRVEAWQIYTSILNGNGWKHHPIVKMWKGHEPALLTYGLSICNEWIKRGYKDTMWRRFIEASHKYGLPRDILLPPWLDEELCISHQSNLLRKDKEYYSKYFPNVPDNLPYKWAVEEE